MTCTVQSCNQLELGLGVESEEMGFWTSMPELRRGMTRSSISGSTSFFCMCNNTAEQCEMYCNYMAMDGRYTVEPLIIDTIDYVPRNQFNPFNPSFNLVSNGGYFSLFLSWEGCTAAEIVSIWWRHLGRVCWKRRLGANSIDFLAIAWQKLVQAFLPSLEASWRF